MSFEVFLLAWFCVRATLGYFVPHLILHALSHTIKMLILDTYNFLYSEIHHFTPEPHQN